MWDSRKMLFATFICTLLSFKVFAGGKNVLDMASDAVDDMYKGCRDKAMELFIKSGLLTQELDHHEEFNKVWTGNDKCPKLISGGIKEHTTALSVMANGDPQFKKVFNNAVKTLGANVSTYENHFYFKALHFLLMDSMRLIQDLTLKQCRTVYLFSEDKYKVQMGSKMRFGEFITPLNSYSELNQYEDFDGNVIFNITSCFFVHLNDSVCSKDTNLILLSPAEVFVVKNVTEIHDTVNESKYTVVVLEHKEMSSSHNCLIFSRSPAVVSAQWFMLGLVVLPLLFVT